MATVTPTLKFTIPQYDLMIEAGVFARTTTGCFESPRVELIEGEIVMMSPIGSRHEEIIDRLTFWSLQTMSRAVARVRVQQSLGIPERKSVPQPDVAWVRPRDYSEHRPDGADAMLVIEVADTSLSHDLGEKAAVYAAGGIPDYWVVDVAAEAVHVLRGPGPTGYVEHRTASRGEVIAPLAAADTSLAVESLFARGLAW